MNRRYFFQSAALAVTTRRLAQPAADRVNLAIIGAGGRGRALAGTFASLAEASIEYIVEVDPRNASPAASVVEKVTSKRPKIAADMRRVFDDKAIDAVIIATPDHWHAPAAILACAAGKDVYVEKPCAHNIREGRKIVDAARRNQRIVQHGTQARSRDCVLRAMDYVHSGRIGRVLMAKAWNVQKRRDIGHKPDGPVPPGVDYETWVGPAPFLPFNENRFHYNWHWHWNFGTGDVGNDGAHQLDMARWALGVEYPEEVTGSAAKLYFDDDQQTPDTMNIAFRYPGKMLLFEMRIWNSYAMEGIENGVGVYGSDGMVQIGKWDRQWAFKAFDASGKVILTHKSEDDDISHARNFLECVRSRKAPNAEIEIGQRTAVHCHLGNIVARTGRAVKFDGASESIVGDPAAGKLVSREYRSHWSTPKLT